MMSIFDEIESTIEQFFHAMDTQNLSLMEQLIPKTNSTVHIGTGRGEIWKGWQILNNATKQQFKTLEYYKADIRDLTININKSEEVAWYFHLLDAEIKSGERLTRWKGARFSGVVEKRNGRWTLAQTHVSLPESD